MDLHKFALWIALDCDIRVLRFQYVYILILFWFYYDVIYTWLRLYYDFNWFKVIPMDSYDSYDSHMDSNESYDSNGFQGLPIDYFDSYDSHGFQRRPMDS